MAREKGKIAPRPSDPYRTVARARQALHQSARHGKPEDHEKVKAEVQERYPDMLLDRNR